MNGRVLSTASLLVLLTGAFTLNGGQAWAKGHAVHHAAKSFRVAGTVQSVDADQNRITLASKKKHAEVVYTVAPNATVKSGRERKSLADVTPGMRVRLRGILGADKTRTVQEITLPAAPRRGKSNGALSGPSARPSRRYGQGS
ncbi:MAG: hypothetical protein HY320_01800 [Armatimonadetes bacterium]|nr:hypothetical protein [Armatimonadota bacterium]